MPIFTNLKELKYALVFAGVVFLLFDVSYYLMVNLPGTRNFACVMGANLTPLNIGFSVVMSLLVGLLMTGFVALFSQQYKEKKAAMVSLSAAQAGPLAGFGLVAGVLSLFCTVCTFPVLLLFGVSVGLEFFTDYHVLVKIISLGLLGAAVFLLNRQLARQCAVCKVPEKRS